MRTTNLKRMKPFIFSCFVILSIFMTFLIVPLNKALALTEDEHTAKLVAGAKKEGNLLWYTTFSVGEDDIVRKKFMDKYPFINVKFYRSGDVALLTKIFAEAQAKRNIVDIVDITGIGAEILRKRGLFAKYISPHWKFYSAGSKDPEGYWTDMYTNLNVIGYNTKLVSAKEVPKTYEDFLAPKWKGKIGMDTKAYYWFANILKVMGEKKGLDYMKRLSEQNIQFRTGRTLNAQMVAAGEVSIGIALYNQRVEEIKAKGAAIEWVAVEPVVPEIHPLLISANAPNPNAARLLVDFLLSREGQELIAGFLRIPSRIDVDPILPKLKKGIKVLPFDSGITDDYDRYIKLYREVLMKK